MTARRLGALSLLLILGGCGSGAATRTPAVGQIPLVPGAQVAAQARECDPGSSTYCAIELVVLDHRYRSSDTLASDERLHLQKLGWSIANGDTGIETAANSPNHGLRVTYATAGDDLQGIDLGWIKRAQPITMALSKSMFDRDAAMSMMLEVGAS
jgi:hypothetical protein